MERILKIILDLMKGPSYDLGTVFTQNDSNTHYLQLEFKDKELNLIGKKIRVNFIRADGKVVFHLADINSEIIKILVPTNALEISGDLGIEITLIDEDKFLTINKIIKLKVLQTVTGRDVELIPSNDLVNDLNDLMTKIVELTVEKANEELEKLSTSIKNEITTTAESKIKEISSEGEKQVEKIIETGSVLSEKIGEVNQKVESFKTENETQHQEIYQEIEASEKRNIDVSRIPDRSLSSSKFKIGSNADRIKLENLSDEVKLAMTGNTPVSPTLEENSVVREYIANKAIDSSKIDESVYHNMQEKYGECIGSFPLTEAQYNGIYWDSTTRNYYRCIKAYKGDSLSSPNMNFEKISVSTNKEELDNLKCVLNGESYSILSWESGGIVYVSETEPFIYKDASNIIRTPQNLFYNLKVGDRISFSGIELYKMQIRIVYDDGTYGSYSPLNLTEYIVSRNAKYQIVVLSNDASSLRDKVEEVGSLVTITTYDKGIVGEIENIETRVEVLEKQNQLVDTKNKYSITNICSENYVINQPSKGFQVNNCVGIEEDGWFKITPSLGKAYCSLYYYSDNFNLKAGKYLITYTMKVDNTTGILKTVRGRVFNGDSGKNVFTVPKGNSIYGVRRTQSLVITTGKEYDSLSLYFEFSQAITEENKIDIYIKDISMINIDELYTPYCGYSIANAIEGQLNGIVNGTQVLDMSLESLYPIWNHTIALFGDSIFDLGTIDERLAINTKARVYNCAKGGETAVYGQISPSWKTESVFTLYKISESIKSGDWSSQIAQNENKGNLLNSIDFNNLDYMFILIGTNDWRRNPKIGENDSVDVTTFKGAMNVILDNILSTYPDINIVLMTPLFRMEFGNSDTTPNDNGTYLYEIGNAMIEIAKKFHLPYFDTYYEGGVNKYNHQIYLSDKTHPTTAYDEKLATIIENIIKSKCLRAFGREVG